jgi:hypothetical protein
MWYFKLIKNRARRVWYCFIHSLLDELRRIFKYIIPYEIFRFFVFTQNYFEEKRDL